MENFISENIAYLLNREKSTQDEFGAMFELKKGVINQYLLKKSNPKIETLIKICDHYKISLDQLVRTSLEEEIYKRKEEKPTILNEPPPGYGFISLKYVETLEKAVEDKEKIIKLYEEKLK